MQYLLEPSDVLQVRRPRRCWRASCWTPRISPSAPAAAPSRRRPTCAVPGRTPQDVQRHVPERSAIGMIARYAIIRQAELYRDDMAVVALDEECDRVTAAKAADELLTLKGIRASFVLYKTGHRRVYVRPLAGRGERAGDPGSAGRRRKLHHRRRSGGEHHRGGGPRQSCWRPSTTIWKTNVKETYRHEDHFDSRISGARARRGR